MIEKNQRLEEEILGLKIKLNTSKNNSTRLKI